MVDGSKTEKATPKKRRDERKKGNVFLSQDAVSVATLLTSACLLIAMADGIAARLGEFIVFCVRSPSTRRRLCRLDARRSGRKIR